MGGDDRSMRHTWPRRVEVGEEDVVRITRHSKSGHRGVILGDTDTLVGFSKHACFDILLKGISN